MAEQTPNFNLTKDASTDYYNIDTTNTNLDKIDKALGNTSKFEKAGGTATTITLTGLELIDGHSKVFIVSANNNGNATTINGKPLYKPGTTSAPKLIKGKSVVIWYDAVSDCFWGHPLYDTDTVNGYTVEANVPSNAKFTDTVYTHPSTHPASMIEESSSRRFVSNTEKSTWNNKANASHTHDDRYYTESEVDSKLNAKANLNSPNLTGIPKAPSGTDYTTSRIRNISFGTTEPTYLANGEIYFMYE